MSVGLFHGAPLWIIDALFLAVMLAASEAGFRLGRRAESNTTDETKSQIWVVESGLLGVLALLLGFTTSMAVTRFEVRKQLAVEEANAIETSGLRTQLLPVAERNEIATLLCEYVDVRLQYAHAGDDLAQLRPLRGRALQLQREFWPRAVAYAREDPNAVKAGLLLQSLNQAIDLESARWMAFMNRVPQTLIYVIVVMGILAATVVGYAFGLAGQHRVFSVCILALSVTLVLGVIIDLDEPTRGRILVGQQPMIDLQGQLCPPRT
jgi:hypothetical protein